MRTPVYETVDMETTNVNQNISVPSSIVINRCLKRKAYDLDTSPESIRPQYLLKSDKEMSNKIFCSTPNPIISQKIMPIQGEFQPHHHNLQHHHHNHHQHEHQQQDILHQNHHHSHQPITVQCNTNENNNCEVSSTNSIAEYIHVTTYNNNLITTTSTPTSAVENSEKLQDTTNSIVLHDLNVSWNNADLLNLDNKQKDFAVTANQETGIGNSRECKIYLVLLNRPPIK